VGWIYEYALVDRTGPYALTGAVFSQDRAALAVEELLDLVGVDAGRWDPRAESVQREHERREEDAAPQLRHAPGVREPGEHLALLPFLDSRLAALGLGLGLALRGLGCFLRCLLDLGRGLESFDAIDAGML